MIYHNRFAEARGWIRLSAGYLAPSGSGGYPVKGAVGTPSLPAIKVASLN